MITDSLPLRRALVSGLAAGGLLVLLLAGCTQSPEPTASTPEPTRLSMSVAGDLTYLCLRDRGWEVDIDWDGGILSDSTKIPAAQLDLYLADEKDCLQTAWSSLKIDDAEKDRLYAAELATKECLENEGHEIPEPPSEQVYLDSYDAGPWMAWSYVDVRPLSEDEFKALNMKCPQPQWSAGG